MRLLINLIYLNHETWGPFDQCWSSAVLLLDIDIQFRRKIRTFIDYWTSTSDILKNIYFPTIEHNCKDNLPKKRYFLNAIHFIVSQKVFWWDRNYWITDNLYWRTINNADGPLIKSYQWDFVFGFYVVSVKGNLAFHLRSLTFTKDDEKIDWHWSQFHFLL